MKKTLLICSDIEGTYNVLNTRKQIEMLKHIDDIKSKLHLDQTVFCFISALGCKEIEEVVNNSLLPILEETKQDTIVGPHFGHDGYTYNGSVPKLFTKDGAKGVQMAHLIETFATFIPDSKVSEFIYIDDAPNINPVFFLMHMDKKDKDLENVTFLVKKDEFSHFIEKEKCSFNISVIENKAVDFMMLGMEEISNSINDIRKAR